MAEDKRNMNDTKVYDQTLKELQSHYLPFLSDFISKIKTKCQTDQVKFVSKLEKLYQHANRKELKLEFMIKIEKTIRKLKEKYELKIVDTSTKKTSIQTTELIEYAAIKKDDLSDEASVYSVSSDSSSPSRHFDRIASIEIPKSDKYRNDRHGSQNKRDRFPSDIGERCSSRYDGHEPLKRRDPLNHDRLDSSERPCKSDRYRYEHSYEHGSRQVKEGNRDKNSDLSKNEWTNVEGGSDFETEITCEHSDRHSAVGHQNSKLFVNPICSNSVFNRFGTKIAKVSSDERLIESEASELRARHSQIFGCDSDNEDGLELKNLIDLRAKLFSQIAEREKRNEQRATTSELSKISSDTPIPKTGLKIKLDLLKLREASKECTSALSTESGKKDSSKFSFTETFNQTSKSTKKYSAASRKPLGFACIDDDIITKVLTQPNNEKNDVTPPTSKDFTTAQNISDPWIMDVVKQALVTAKKTEEGKSYAAEVAANTRERNSSSVRDARAQPQQDSMAPPTVSPSQESLNMNGLAAQPKQQHTFPSTLQCPIQSRPNLIIKELPNYNNQLPPVNIKCQTYEQSRSVHSLLSLDSEKKKAPMTYGEYKSTQQAVVSSTSNKFNKNKAPKVSGEYNRNLQAVVSSTSDKFIKNRAQMTSGEYKCSQQMTISSTPEKFDKKNVTSTSSTDISKSHLDNIYRSGNFSTKPNLLVTGSKSDSGQKFKIPMKKSNSDVLSNEQSNFREVKDLDGPNLSVTGSKPNSDNNYKIRKKKPNGAGKPNDNHSNEQPNFREVRDLDDSESEVIGNGKSVINCDFKASESRDPPISVNAVKKKSALDGKKMKESSLTELPNDVVTNSTSFLADKQLTATQEDIESMLQPFMNPNNLLTLMTLCAERSDDQMFSKIKDIIQRSNATNHSSIEERTDGTSTLVEAGKNFPKTPRRKNELEKLNEDTRTMLISDGVLTATGRRTCSAYKKANKEPATVLQNVNTEKKQNRSKDDGAVVNQRTVEPPSNGARSMRRRNTMIGYKESSGRYMPPPAERAEVKSRRPIYERKTTKTVESNGDNMNESPRVTQSRLTKECTVVLKKLHPGSTVKSLTIIASLNKDEGGNRRIEEIDEVQDIKTGKKKRLSSHTIVVKNNNPEWHCLKKGMECQLCEKAVGISLVSHYVNSHPNKEVFPSRVAPDVADFLRNSREEHKVECIASKRSMQHRFKQRCYFCNETKSLLRKYWIQHTAVHTGYYQYKCTDCNRRFSGGSINHSCRGTTKNKIVEEALPQLNKNEIFGYLCDLCNFVRFDENEMAKHSCCEHEYLCCYKKVVFLSFPSKKMKLKIQSNTCEQIDTPDVDIRPHVDPFAESNSRKRSKRSSNMDNDDAELEDNLPEKVPKKNKGMERVITEYLNPLICDEGIPIVIKTQTDDDNLAEGTPMEQTSSRTRASVRENNCTAPVTRQPLGYIIVKDEENCGPMESEIPSIIVSEREHWEPVNAGSTNNDVEMDNLNCPAKVLTRVYNMGYTKSFDIMGNQSKFSCFIDLCEFETMHLDSILSHIEDHTVKWTGFCFTCNAQIINNQVPLMMEFKHMTEAHLNKMDDSDCNEKSGERTHFTKCIELSKLQEAGYAAAAPSSSFECENDFMKITNVKSLPITNVDVSSFVISNVVSLEANKPDHCDAEVIVLKIWTRNPTSKLQSYCKRMMRDISMFALFKCMDVKCCFTTNNDEIMLKHLQNHEIRLLSQMNSFDAHTSSWLECAYCDEVGDSCLLLVKHIQDEHQSSIFQCSYCFYRSIAAYNVIVHLSQFHRSKEKLVLVCSGKTKGYETEKALIERSRKKFVRPLRCSEDCKKSTFVMDYFVQHMKTSPHHSNSFKCQFCGFNILITKAVKHLLCHRIGIFECIYCQYGTNDIASIQKHMCNSHASKLLYICVRLTRKLQILTDEQLSSVESTLIVDIGQPVNAKFFQRCPYSEQQLNFLGPSIDINSNISAAIVSAPIAYIKPSTLFNVPTVIEIDAAASMSNETFFNADTLGSSSDRDTRLMLNIILSYKDLEKEYISDDYDKCFQNEYPNYIGSLPLPEQPYTLQTAIEDLLLHH